MMVALLLGVGGSGWAQQGPAPFHGDIEKLAKQNRDFRWVLFTGAHTQVVAMSIPSGQDIGAEAHPVNQCFFFVEGEGESVVAGKTGKLQDDDVLCVPAGMQHNVRNTGRKALKLYTCTLPRSIRPARCTTPRRKQKRPRPNTRGERPTHASVHRHLHYNRLIDSGAASSQPHPGEDDEGEQRDGSGAPAGDRGRSSEKIARQARDRANHDGAGPHDERDQDNQEDDEEQALVRPEVCPRPLRSGGTPASWAARRVASDRIS